MCFFSAVVTTCEQSSNNSMNITCPGNSHIVIQQANYGRLNQSTCCIYAAACTKTNCVTPGALSIVKNQYVLLAILYHLDKLELASFSYFTLHVVFSYRSSMTSSYGFIYSLAADDV